MHYLVLSTVQSQGSTSKLGLDK